MGGGASECYAVVLLHREETANNGYCAGILRLAELLTTAWYPTHPPTQKRGLAIAVRKDAADPRVLHFPSRATV
jgi:hypothetical protein